MSSDFEIALDDDFDLGASAEFLRGFRPAAGGAVGEGTRLALGLLADGSFEPVAVALEQRGRVLHGSFDGSPADQRKESAGMTNPTWSASVSAGAIAAQVARMLSLDVDASQWADVQRRDPVVAGLQARFPGFRPVCFPSPYEAAGWGILAHRISMVQASALKAKLAREHGAVLHAGGHEVLVVPPPARMLTVEVVPGLAAEKLRRIHGIAEAALAGRLAAEHLRALPEADALAELSALRGVGPWTAAHILFRGAALSDALAGGEPRVLRGAKIAYDLPATPTVAELATLAERWRPFRMWVAILLVRSIAGTDAWHERGDGEVRGGKGRARVTPPGSRRGRARG